MDGSAFVCLVVLALGPDIASPPPPPAVEESVPDDATLEASGAVVGEITIEAGEIFDPERGEDNAVFRFANKIHVNTREATIREQLLFVPGDRYSRRVLDESERLLRSNGYLYAAEIRPVRYDGDRVDVVVATRDVWTLKPGIGFRRSGGQNSSRFSIEDENFLGTGKTLTFRRTSNVDRTENLVRYRDPNFLGRHGRVQLAYSDNSDGVRTLVGVERPFYGMDTRWALGGIGERNDRTDPLYKGGEVESRFQHEEQRFEVYAGFSAGLVGGRARRWLAGFTHAENRFAVAAGYTPPEVLPEDRTLSYPWIGFEEVHDRYITVHDMERIARTEDYNLGRELRARLGYSSPAFGADRSRVMYEAAFAQGFNPGDGQMMFLTASLTGRYGVEGEGVENLIVGGGLRSYVRNFGRHIFFATVRGDVAHHLDGEDQLLLGGDNGLRGYPMRYESGDRRFLVSVEQRFYTDWHLLKLVHVGGAVFFDAGRAWSSADTEASLEPFLQDVGLGLRLSSSRSSQGGMVHVDVAFPLNPPEGVSKAQFLVSAGKTF